MILEGITTVAKMKPPTMIISQHNTSQHKTIKAPFWGFYSFTRSIKPLQVC